MPWCGYGGAPLAGFWWLLPFFGFVFMAFMVFVCLRGFGSWTRRPRRQDSEISELRREVAGLRDELLKLRQAAE
jgi:hypothetical protein